MVKARTWFALFILSLGTVAATTSCGGSDEATGAKGGDGGGGGLAGGGIIGGSGRGGAVGRAGAPGSGAEAGAAGDDSTALSAPCTTDAQCGAGLSCLTAISGTSGREGPAHGMCTKECAVDSDCPGAAGASRCLPEGAGVCYATCEPGGMDDATAATKCGGRGDFVCDQNTAVRPVAVCLPRCRGDFDCGTGLFCDKNSGLCSNTKPTGSPPGTVCNPAATPDTCNGFCIFSTATPQTGVCAEPCSGLFGCAFDSSGNPGGLCWGALGNDVFGVRDQGYCERSCNCTSDCSLPGEVCRAWLTSDPNEAMLARTYGAPGLCLPGVSGSTELSCGEGGATGAGGADNGPDNAGASGAP